jgi:hypothetical protein
MSVSVELLQNPGFRFFLLNVYWIDMVLIPYCNGRKSRFKYFLIASQNLFGGMAVGASHTQGFTDASGADLRRSQLKIRNCRG